MPKVMVIAGGEWQCPIVKLIKNMGHYVICTNLYHNSPAFKYADLGIVVDVLNKEENLKIAQKYNPDAVVTEQSDIAVPTVAYVAEELKLKGITTTIAGRFTNKYLMRRYTEKAGFKSPKYKLCLSQDDARTFFKDINTKCIIKPIDSQSSRGVHIINSLEDIDRNFPDTIHYSNAEKAVLIEEYIDGTEFTVDGLKTEKEYIITAISEKEHYDYNPNIAKRLVFSEKNDLYDYEKLRKINTEMVFSLGLPFGLTHAEYKYSNGNFYLIEIAARGGGTKISSDIVPLVSGINSNEVYLNLVLNKPYTIQVRKRYPYAVLGFFDFKTGTIVDIRGLEKAKSISGLWDMSLNINIGTVLTHASDDRSRCGHYIIYANSKEQLEERENLLKNTIQVITE